MIETVLNSPVIAAIITGVVSIILVVLQRRNSKTKQKADRTENPQSCIEITQKEETVKAEQ
ncbi:hypothetical protein [Acanthopleuribacter pedis]|uniref:Uncharacterized protein n=1 Tax=Acanthopleuribacter pedis TaxID=442870 RepID=A0A8J7QGR7_9BACT|nr:hypothetical protein [Acanthopleuribacter pedis]MBO1318280.1 hypothetical protein [Acanthopleuribacter pedis]